MRLVDALYVELAHTPASSSWEPHILRRRSLRLPPQALRKSRAACEHHPWPYTDGRSRKAPHKLERAQPVGLLEVGVLHHVDTPHDPYGIMRAYVDALASGSRVAIRISMIQTMAASWRTWRNGWIGCCSPRRRSRAGFAPAPRSRRCLPALSWWNRAWCGWRIGGPMGHAPRAWPIRNSSSSVASPASPNHASSRHRPVRRCRRHRGRLLGRITDRAGHRAGCCMSNSAHHAIGYGLPSNFGATLPC